MRLGPAHDASRAERLLWNGGIVALSFALGFAVTLRARSCSRAGANPGAIAPRDGGVP